MNVTDIFLARIRELWNRDISSQVLHQVERCLLDYTGAVFAGRRGLEKRLDAFEAFGDGDTCSVIATGERKDCFTASMMNGFAAHILELDDGHRVGAPHLEAVIFSAMIAAAQKEKISFENFVKGILVGYEAVIRLSSAMQPSLKLKGFHATGVCGSIGVVCAVGCAVGLDDVQLKAALSAAATGSAGILQVLDDDSELKPYNVSHAILAGLSAVSIAKCGFRGPDDVLGGKRGYLRAYSDAADLDLLLGEYREPAIFQIYVKPYASCRHSHPAVECAFRILEERALQPDEIESIEVQTYKLGIQAHDHTEVTGVSSAKMSTPYSLAAAIVLGSCGIEAFAPETLARQEIRSLTRKVRVVENEELTRACPAKRGAVVSVWTKDGQLLRERVENPLGEPENPLTDTQLEEKYKSLMAAAGVAPTESDRWRALIWDLRNRYKEFIEAI